jgi:hypothetical protein
VRTIMLTSYADDEAVFGLDHAWRICLPAEADERCSLQSRGSRRPR